MFGRRRRADDHCLLRACGIGAGPSDWGARTVWSGIQGLAQDTSSITPGMVG